MIYVDRKSCGTVTVLPAAASVPNTILALRNHPGLLAEWNFVVRVTQPRPLRSYERKDLNYRKLAIFIMDQLPAYEAPTLPIYSPATAGPSRLSSRTDSTYSSLHTSDHTYKSDHLLVNLGPRRWGTRLPAYGYHGVLDGTVKVRKACSHVISVTATVSISCLG